MLAPTVQETRYASQPEPLFCNAAVLRQRMLVEGLQLLIIWL